MFALEIDFHDGVSSPEILLVRRPHVIIGTSENAHVVIEGAASSLVELRVLRGLGREFRCHPIVRSGVSPSRIPFLEGVYSGDANISLGDVRVHITALDNDLRLFPDEAPDLAGLRIVRKALSQSSPLFPAVAVLGATPLFVSFSGDEPLIIGRSRKCALRLESSDISSEHARVGFENGQLWIEDLGSTNGTFIGSERVAGRQVFSVGEIVKIGGDYRLAAVQNPQDIAALKIYRDEFPEQSTSREVFPCIISESELIRPARFAMSEGSVISVGRDPTNDIWVGAPHISRKHLEISTSDLGIVEICDLSSNGTFINGEMLPKGSKIELPRERTIIDLNEGVSLILCYSKEDCHSQCNISEKKEAKFDNNASSSTHVRASYPSSHRNNDIYTQVFKTDNFDSDDLDADIREDQNLVSGRREQLPESNSSEQVDVPMSVFDRLLKQQGLANARHVDDELNDSGVEGKEKIPMAAGGKQMQQTMKQLPLVLLIVVLAAFCIWTFWEKQVLCMFGGC